MFKRLLIAASFVAASLSFQTSAQANGGVVVKIGGGHGLHKGTRVHKKFHKPRRKIHRQRQVYKKPVHKAPIYKAPVYKAALCVQGPETLPGRASSHFVEQTTSPSSESERLI